jgi:hypothetical protein
LGILLLGLHIVGPFILFNIATKKEQWLSNEFYLFLGEKNN